MTVSLLFLKFFVFYRTLDHQQRVDFKHILYNAGYIKTPGNTGWEWLKQGDHGDKDATAVWRRFKWDSKNIEYGEDGYVKRVGKGADVHDESTKYIDDYIEAHNSVLDFDKEYNYKKDTGVTGNAQQSQLPQYSPSTSTNNTQANGNSSTGATSAYAPTSVGTSNIGTQGDRGQSNFNSTGNLNWGEYKTSELKPGLIWRIDELAKQFGEKTGEKLVVTDGFRTKEDIENMREKYTAQYGKPTADEIKWTWNKPDGSTQVLNRPNPDTATHMTGRAVDLKIEGKRWGNDAYRDLNKLARGMGLHGYTNTNTKGHFNITKNMDNDAPNASSNTNNMENKGDANTSLPSTPYVSSHEPAFTAPSVSTGGSHDYLEEAKAQIEQGYNLRWSKNFIQ